MIKIKYSDGIEIGWRQREGVKNFKVGFDEF